MPAEPISLLHLSNWLVLGDTRYGIKFLSFEEMPSNLVPPYATIITARAENSIIQPRWSIPGTLD